LAIYFLVCSLHATLGSGRGEGDDSIPCMVIGWVLVFVESASLYQAFEHK